MFRLTCVKLTCTTGKCQRCSNSMTFLSPQLVEIDKNYWLTLPRWNSLCHRLSRVTSFFQRPREAEKRDPGNEVGTYGRSYADVITKFSRFDGLPIFLTHGASLARSAR